MKIVINNGMKAIIATGVVCALFLYGIPLFADETFNASIDDFKYEIDGDRVLLKSIEYSYDDEKIEISPSYLIEGINIMSDEALN